MTLHLPITDRCNLRCVFCSAWGREGGEALPALLQRLRTAPAGPVQVSGGEPTLRPQSELWRLLLECRLQGRPIEFQTNGTLLGAWPEERLRLLARLADQINVNFSAHTPALEAGVSGMRGALKRRERAVRRLVAAGARVRLTHVVCAQNHRALEGFVRYVRRRLPGVREIQFSFVKGMGRAAQDRAVVPRYGEAGPFLNKALSLCRKLGLAAAVDHIPVCFLPAFRDFHVDSRKVRHGRTGPYLEEKAHVPECVPCRFKPECPGPRKDYVALYGGL